MDLDNEKKQRLLSVLDRTKKVPTTIHRQRSFRLSNDLENQLFNLCRALTLEYENNISLAHIIRALLVYAAEDVGLPPKPNTLEELPAAEQPESEKEDDADPEEEYILKLLGDGPIHPKKKWNP